jgi:hypothetical protein
MDLEWHVTHPGDHSGMMKDGFAQLLVWLSVIEFPACMIFYPPNHSGTSLAFSVVVQNTKKADRCIGDHENYDKKSICSTMVKLVFTHESELRERGEIVDIFDDYARVLTPLSGFRSFGSVVDSVFTRFVGRDKGPHSSAAFVRGSMVDFPKKDKDLILKVAREWERNPNPKVTAALEAPTSIPTSFFYWPAIPSTIVSTAIAGSTTTAASATIASTATVASTAIVASTTIATSATIAPSPMPASSNEVSGGEPPNKRPRIEPPAVTSEPIMYHLADDPFGGCSHYSDSRSWNTFFES